MRQITAVVVYVGAGLLVSGFQCNGGGGGDIPPPPPACPGGGPELTTACCSGGTPANYLKTNDEWSPTSCGSPSSIVYNVCTYRCYANKPVGSIMVICAGQTLPAGWVLQDTDWSPTSCGHPSSIIDNVWTIKKLQQ